MANDPRSSARAAVLVTALNFEPRPLDLFALFRVPAIVRYVTAPALRRCCRALRRRARRRRA